MRKSRYSYSLIMTILNLDESGVSVSDLCHEHGMSTGICCKWRAKFFSMNASMMKRLKELKDENRRLKNIKKRQW